MTHGAERRTSRIPDFASIEEEAEFWDTHDITDYLDELRPVKVRVSPTFSSVYTVPLDMEDYEELAHYAREQGSDPSTLVRIWIKERLRAERAKQPAPR